METYKIVIGGDIFPRQRFELFTQGAIDKLYAPEILDLFHRADLAICNLEGALTDTDTKTPKCGPSIKAPPETIRGIRDLGVDCLTLANNHVMDYGAQGYADTCRVLEENGIHCFGAGKNSDSIQSSISVNARGKTVTFYAVAETVFNIPGSDTPGVNLYDEYRVCNELRELKQRSDMLIVLYHGGVEYYRYPTPWVRTRFHRMADCGADLILAQHTHCIGAQEDYNGAYLLYGQGNFHFIQHNEADVTQTGLLLEVDLSDQGFEVKPHLIGMDGDLAYYDEKQDLSDFLERNRRLSEGESFDREFSVYCEKWMIRWLLEFRGKTLKDKLMRKLLPKDKFIRYLRNDYEDYLVLRMLEHVRGEEDVEVMQKGLEDFSIK